MPADNILPIAPAAQPLFVRKHPFNVGQKCRIKSLAGGTTLKGINRFSRLTDPKLVVATGDGVKTQFTENELPALAGYTPVVTPTLDDRLLAICRLLNDLRDEQPLTLVGSGGTPTATEFRIFDDSGTITLEFGAAPRGEFELQIGEASDITTFTGGALVAGRPYEIEATAYFSASVGDDVFLERILC